jgi:uncharacterized RDD family membrane protein YckC
LLLDGVCYQVVIFFVALFGALASPEFVLVIQDYSLLLTIAVMLVYYVACEAILGRTPAKLITGTRVVTETGEPPSFGQVLGRTLARFVPFEPFSCLGDPPVGWHDSWSHTRVVRTRPSSSLGPGYLLRNSDESQGPTGLGLR